MKLSEDLLAIINIAQKKLSEISDLSAKEKITINKWSRNEILGHLIDSANVNYYRFLLALDKDKLIFDTYPQDEWVRVQDYNNRNWNELVKCWNSINLQIIHLINNIPIEKLKQTTDDHNFDRICWQTVDKKESATLEYLINDYIGHLEHHLKQIYNYQKG